MADSDILPDNFPDLLPEEVAHLPAWRKPKEWHKTLAQVTLPGPWAEFGVAKGRNIRKFMVPAARGVPIYAFDSWEGLPEHWERGASKPARPKGAFACTVPAFNASNVHIVKGLFSVTCPQHVDGPPFAFISLDADLYSSTKTVLWTLNARIVKGTVIRFDEYQGYELAAEHEPRALLEWCKKFDRQARFFVRGLLGASCIITR